MMHQQQQKILVTKTLVKEEKNGDRFTLSTTSTCVWMSVFLVYIAISAATTIVLSYTLNASITAGVALCALNSCLVLSSCFLFARNKEIDVAAVILLTGCLFLWMLPVIMLSISADQYSYYHSKLLKDASVSDTDKILSRRHTAFDFNNGELDYAEKVTYVKTITSRFQHSKTYYHFIPFFSSFSPQTPDPTKVSFWVVRESNDAQLDYSKFSRKVIKVQHEKQYKHMLQAKAKDPYMQGKMVLFFENSYEDVKRRIRTLFFVGLSILAVLSVCIFSSLGYISFMAGRKQRYSEITLLSEA